ncbi:MAG: LEA type 2 family protein [Thermoanaerobaculia bacterium]
MRVYVRPGTLPVMTVAFRILALVLAAAASAAPAQAPSPSLREFRVGPIDSGKAGMELVFEANGAPCGEWIRGTFTLFGSAPGVPVDAPLVYIPEGGCALRFDYPFTAIGPDLVGQSKVDALEWSLTGERRSLPPAKPISWSGRAPRETIKLTESMKVTLRRFVDIQNVGVGSLGLTSSTVNAVLDVTNPLSFDLRIAEAAYELTVDGKPVARGRKEKFLLHAKRANRLELPIELDHAGLLAAAGKAALGKGVSGVLSGVGRLRLPAGDLEFPFEFPVTLSRN